MRISGTKPSSVILLPNKSSSKSWKMMPQKYQNKLKPKGMV